MEVQDRALPCRARAAAMRLFLRLLILALLFAIVVALLIAIVAMR